MLKNNFTLNSIEQKRILNFNFPNPLNPYVMAKTFLHNHENTSAMKHFGKKGLLRLAASKICTASILLFGLNASAQNNFVINHRNNPLKDFAVASNKESHPFFVDIDGDGDLDCFSGEYANSQGAKIYFFRNDGTNKNPQFKKINGAENPLHKATTNVLTIPYFIDIDGDGDYDCFIGEGTTGAIVYYKNIGDAKNARYEKQSAANNPLSMVKFLTSGVASPAFADIDGDGDFDCLVSDDEGNEIYLKNAGTVKAPSFVHETGSDDPFNNLASNTGFFNVSFHDWNHDGLQDLFINTTYYENVGTATRAAFMVSGDNKPSFERKADDQFTYTPLRWVDLRNDGSTQVFMGTAKGSYIYQTLPAPNVSAAATTPTTVRVFPNPTKEEFFVNLPTSDVETVIRLTDGQGKLVMTQIVNGSSIKFGKELKPGAYFIQVMQNDKVIFSQKLIKG
jgi:hypothetical protein